MTTKVQPRTLRQSIKSLFMILFYFFFIFFLIVWWYKLLIGTHFWWNKLLIGTHFCKTLFMFVKQNSRVLPKTFLFNTPVSVLFLKTICFFFLVDPTPFFKTIINCFHFFFYLILLYTHKIKIIIFF